MLPVLEQVSINLNCFSPDYDYDFSEAARPTPFPEELGSRLTVRNRARGSSSGSSRPTASSRFVTTPELDQQPTQNRGQDLRQPVTARPRPRETTIRPPPTAAPVNDPRLDAPRLDAFSAFQTPFDFSRSQIQEIERRREQPSSRPEPVTQASVPRRPQEPLTTQAPFRFRPQEAVRSPEVEARPVFTEPTFSFRPQEAVRPQEDVRPQEVETIQNPLRSRQQQAFRPQEVEPTPASFRFRPQEAVRAQENEPTAPTFRLRPQDAIIPQEPVRAQEPAQEPLRFRPQEAVRSNPEQERQNRPIRLRLKEELEQAQQEPEVPSRIRPQEQQAQSFIPRQILNRQRSRPASAEEPQRSNQIEQKDEIKRRPSRPRNFDPRRQRVSIPRSEPSPSVPSRPEPVRSQAFPVRSEVFPARSEVPTITPARPEPIRSQNFPVRSEVFPLRSEVPSIIPARPEAVEPQAVEPTAIPVVKSDPVSQRLNLNRQRGRSRRPQALENLRAQEIPRRPSPVSRVQEPSEEPSSPSDAPSFASFPVRSSSRSERPSRPARPTLPKTEPTFASFSAVEPTPLPPASPAAPVEPDTDVPTFSSFPANRAVSLEEAPRRPAPTQPSFNEVPILLPTRPSRPAILPVRQPERSFAPTPVPVQDNASGAPSRFSSFPIKKKQIDPNSPISLIPQDPAPGRSEVQIPLRAARPTADSSASAVANDPRRVNFDALIEEFTGGRASLLGSKAGARATSEPSFFNAIPLDSQSASAPAQFRPQPAVPGASFDLFTEL